jgi:hypothetical protein
VDGTFRRIWHQAVDLYSLLSKINRERMLGIVMKSQATAARELTKHRKIRCIFIAVTRMKRASAANDKQSLSGAAQRQLPKFISVKHLIGARYAGHAFGSPPDM